MDVNAASGHCARSSSTTSVAEADAVSAAPTRAMPAASVQSARVFFIFGSFRLRRVERLRSVTTREGLGVAPPLVARSGCRPESSGGLDGLAARFTQSFRRVSLCDQRAEKTALRGV